MKDTRTIPNTLKCEFKKEVVALACRLLTIIQHLLTNKEIHEDKKYDKKGEVSIPGCIKLVVKIGVNETISLIQMASMEKLMNSLDDLVNRKKNQER